MRMKTTLMRLKTRKMVSDFSLTENEGGVVASDGGGAGDQSSNLTTGVENPVYPIRKVTRRKSKDEDLHEVFLQHIFSHARALLEELIVPNEGASLNKKRHTMPQLKEFDEFKADLEANGINISAPKSIKPDGLKPTQNNFNEEKVKDMVEAGTWDSKPIIVSSDNHVVDGHHRWLAAIESKENIDVCVVDMAIEDLLDFLKGKEYVVKNTINQ